MSFSVFKDVKNLKKNSLSTTNLNLDKDSGKKDLTQKQHNDGPQYGDHKIKDFNHKLEQHKSEIEKNNAIISELSNGLLMIKEELLRQTEKSEGEEKKVKQLKEEIEKNNRVLRNRSNKLDEANRKLELAEKELAEARPAIEKNGELKVQVATLTKKVSQLEKSLSDSETQKRNIVNDKDYQIQQLKNTLSLMQARYGESEELKSSVNQKEQQLHVLKNEHSVLAQHLEKERRASVQLLHNNASLQSKLNELIDESKSKQSLLAEMNSLKTQSNQLKKKLLEFQQTKAHLQKTEDFLKKKNFEYEQLAFKYAKSYDENMAEIRQLQDDVVQKKEQIRRLNEDLEAQKQQNYNVCCELEDAAKASKQLVTIRERSSKLQVLYKQLLPPLKCSLCTKDFDKPVTIIPCGHNFCLGCKKGYNKTCLACGPQLKIEAVYRNELLDDIVKVVKDIKELLTLIN